MSGTLLNEIENSTIIYKQSGNEKYLQKRKKLSRSNTIVTKSLINHFDLIFIPNNKFTWEQTMKLFKKINL
jgi:hypothetical protein